jgi:hypothetical protein
MKVRYKKINQTNYPHQKCFIIMQLYIANWHAITFGYSQSILYQSCSYISVNSILDFRKEDNLQKSNVKRFFFSWISPHT